MCGRPHMMSAQEPHLRLISLALVTRRLGLFLRTNDSRIDNSAIIFDLVYKSNSS